MLFWEGGETRTYGMFYLAMFQYVLLLILGKYLLTALVLNLKLSGHVIEAYDGPLKGSTTPMINLGTYAF